MRNARGIASRPGSLSTSQNTTSGSAPRLPRGRTNRGSMFFVPGFAIAIVTFPGVIVHETGHLFFCRLFKLAIYDVCFFRVGNPAGYVIHEKTDNFKKLFFVCMGPFFVNTLLCVAFCTAAFLPVGVLRVVDYSAYFF